MCEGQKGKDGGEGTEVWGIKGSHSRQGRGRVGVKTRWARRNPGCRLH